MLLFLLLVTALCGMAYVAELLRQPKRPLLQRLSDEFAAARYAVMRRAATTVTLERDSQVSSPRILTTVIDHEIGRIPIKRPPRVLVVDDDTAIARLARAVLKESGYRADTATNGAEALRSLHAIDYDLVLLDLIMPGIDGQQVLDEMKSDPATASIPVVVFTAAGAKDIAKIDSDQVATVLRKPAAPSEIVEAVNKHMPTILQ